MRILSVLLPNFPLRCEILRNPEINGCPAMITYGDSSQKLVLDYAPGLERLQEDMPVQQALSIHDKAELIPADIPYYWSTFNKILDEMEKISPLVEGPGLGIVYLGIDGLQLIYPDDDCLVSAVRKVVPEIFAGQIGIAEGKFPSYLAARYSASHDYKTLTGDIRPFLKDISCDVLPVSIKTRNRLHAFGIHTLGNLAALPEGPLQSQFGPEGRIIHNLAAGYDYTPLYPRIMKEDISVSTILYSVTVSMEAIMVAVDMLLSKIFNRLSYKGLGIYSLTLWTRGWDSEHWERNIRFKEPAMEVRTVGLRIKRVLENFPQPGPVEEIGIRVTRLGYSSGRHKSLFSEVRSRDNLIDDIRQLEFRQGNPQIFRIKEVEPWSRIPERRYALAPISR
jgi:DNA polymerase-4/protein ImuB